MRQSIVRAMLALALAGWCVTAEARELLVGSWATHSIRRYDTETDQYLGDLVSSGSGGLNVPDGMDYGPDGHLYVSSSNSNAVLKYDGHDGTFGSVRYGTIEHARESAVWSGRAAVRGQ